MCHFPATETDSDFSFVTSLQKATQVAQFYLIIALISSRTEFNFLDLDLLLVFLLLFRVLSFLVEELTIIHQTTNWWLRIWANFHQINTSSFRCLKSFLNTYDTNLFSFDANQSYLFDANFFIYPIFVRSFLSSFSAFNGSFLQSIN